MAGIRTQCFVVFAALCTTTFATAQSLSISQLTARYLGQEAVPAPDPQVGVALAQAHARGYLEGIADLGQGEHWCLPSHFLRGELFSEAAHELQTHTSAEVDPPAARAVAAYLTSRFPCTK